MSLFHDANVYLESQDEIISQSAQLCHSIAITDRDTSVHTGGITVAFYCFIAAKIVHRQSRVNNDGRKLYTDNNGQFVQFLL